MKDKQTLELKILWFRNLYRDIMDVEGWDIYRYVSENMAYKVTIGYSRSIDSINDAYEMAEQYGWVLDKNGIILDYDPDKHIKNRYLMNCSELGLL